MKSIWRRTFTLLLAGLLLLALSPAPQVEAIPVTGGPVVFAEEGVESVASPLDEFALGVKDGAAGVVRGVYAPGALALRVEQQPETRPMYISAAPDTATQFRYATFTNVIGLLAHNHVSGAQFFNLNFGQEVWIVYGDGAKQGYLVANILRYQALQPASTRSQFLDLDTGEVVSSAQLYDRVYRGEHHLTFQTCIEQGGVATWGRLFVIATPLGELIPALDPGLDVLN
ncbi:MAG: hypothetical protein HYZ49_11820 [Chloroflexi bacterium]|nr:hypothetical protein [Chloroflexota bacterium]